MTSLEKPGQVNDASSIPLNGGALSQLTDASGIIPSPRLNYKPIKEILEEERRIMEDVGD